MQNLNNNQYQVNELFYRIQKAINQSEWGNEMIGIAAAFEKVKITGNWREFWNRMAPSVTVLKRLYRGKRSDSRRWQKN